MTHKEASKPGVRNVPPAAGEGRADLAEIGKRIKAARKALGLTQDVLAAQAGGTSNRGLQDNESGKSMPGGQMIAALVNAGINANWILTGHGQMLLPPRPSATVLHTEQIPPGYVSLATLATGDKLRPRTASGDASGLDASAEALTFNAQWIRYELGADPADLYLMRVSGDAMEPTLRAGDLVLVDRRATTPDCEGTFLLKQGETLLVKRLQAVPGGKIAVTSDNAAFLPWTLDTFEPGCGVTIIGRLVWSGRRH